MPAISISSGTGDTTLVAGSTDRTITVDSITVVPSAAGAFALWSGPSASGTRLTGDIAALAGISYTFFDLKVASGLGLVINRVDAMAVAGAYSARQK